MNKVQLARITDALHESWSADTSSSPEAWSADNPALGQCAVTACVLQDYFGGDILNSVAVLPDGALESHYFNLINGEEIDLTKQQFMSGTQFSPGKEKAKGLASTREYCLSFESTRLRYELLRQRVSKYVH